MTDIFSAIEAILFASGDSIPIARLSLVLRTDEVEIEKAAEALAKRYEQDGRGIRILKLEDRLQMCSSPEYAELISLAMEQRKPAMLSQAALETLAIAAYYQPVTRAYIDQVRGVDSSYTVGMLVERGLIEAFGRLDVPGRPLLYKTTDVFLRTMGISSLDELPQLPDMNSGDGMEKLQAAIDELKGTTEREQIALDEL